MQVIPAIDVLDGRVVRLVQGDFTRQSDFGDDPLGIVEGYRRSGATRLHLVNLSAARDGSGDECFLELLARLSRNIEVQVGGGIRDLRAVQRHLDAGAAAVVIGTMLFADPEAARAAVDLFGPLCVIAALDVERGEVKIRGWRQPSGQALPAGLRLIEEMGIQQVLITDISRDGMAAGPNVALYADCRRQFPRLRITASGGVRGPADVRELAAAGCDAVVVGRALLEGSTSLPSLIGEKTPLSPATAVAGRFAGREFSPLPLGEGQGVRAMNSGQWSVVSSQSAVGSTLATGHRPLTTTNPQSLIPNPSHPGPHPSPLPRGEGTPRTGLAVRVIPCLDVTEGRVVKGTNFQNLRDAGDPVELAKRYCDEGADELVFLDITATSDGRRSAAELASRVADAVNVPFTIGGGVRSVADARRLLEAGADKVTVNSAAVADPSLLEDMARQLGTANTVCAIDARRRGDGWMVLVRGGRDETGIDAVAWAAEAVRRGAGELLVTSHDRDGTAAGFDTALLARIKLSAPAPLIASGGGGSLASFVAAVREGKADAVLAASVFHFGVFSIGAVKTALHNASLPVRL